MNKHSVIEAILNNKKNWLPQSEKAMGYAPTNIALCKYWGKRNTEINLPVTSSLSIALPDKGSLTTLCLQEDVDTVVLNGKPLAHDSVFVKRLMSFLDLFRAEQSWRVKVDIQMTIPVAAGLASSACGFASLVLALNDWFQWGLSKRELSILARLGSGSASRSLWNGFVEWHAGVREDGMDSVAEPISDEWPSLKVGIISLSESEKPISSRLAMQRTVDTSVLYQSWPKKVANDMAIIRQAIHTKNFPLLGGAAESNALAMHATMLASWPPVSYSLPETMSAMREVWRLRDEGMSVYFTQDAGPNLKLLFLSHDERELLNVFPSMSICSVFD